ncbi:MAG: hypothetical protein E6J91_23120 [Deltaproteobacteria bacterium]|nr:MAG: hypothetical protein E6J91_23120 [Deltaproteobacteria bacterium]
MSLLTGCADVAGWPGESTKTSSLVAGNKLVGNKLVGNKLVGNKLVGNKLASNKLSDGVLSVNMDAAGKLLSTEDGREVFSFIVSCALPSDIVLEAVVDGTTFDFFGELGLTPQWRVGPLSSEGRGWISACMFSRVNDSDVPLPISLRGSNFALATTTDERAVRQPVHAGRSADPVDRVPRRRPALAPRRQRPGRSQLCQAGSEQPRVHAVRLRLRR